MVLFRNTQHSYGFISIVLHWLTAVGVIGLFCLGLWMVELDYYDEWYRAAPHYHRSIGVVLIAIVVFRLTWRLFNKLPEALSSHLSWERVVSKIVHIALYFLVILMLPTGYLITTAKGQGLEVFDWFTLPALITGIDGLEAIALEVHELIAFTIIGIAGLHALAALKHHFYDKDDTLKRMLRIKKYNH